MEIIMTRHANARLKERVGVKSERRRKELAEAAFSKGMYYCGSDRYTQNEMLKHSHETGRCLVMYRDQLYIFAGNTLVTVLPVNHEYRRKMELRRAKSNARGAEDRRCARGGATVAVTKLVTQAA